MSESPEICVWGVGREWVWDVALQRGTSLTWFLLQSLTKENKLSLERAWLLAPPIKALGRMEATRNYLPWLMRGREAQSLSWLCLKSCKKCLQPSQGETRAVL